MRFFVFPARLVLPHICIINLNYKSSQIIRMLMYKYFSLLLLMFFTGLVSGQGWERVYSGSGQDAANGLAQTPDGGFILTGRYNGDAQLYLIKTNANGEKQWSKTFPGAPVAVGNRVIVTQDGGYAVVGYVRGEGPLGDNLYVLKTDAFGTLLWKKPLGTNLEDRGTDIVELPNGDLIATGFQVTANGKADVVAIKLDQEGAQQWYKIYGYTNVSEKATGRTLMPNGDIVIVA